MTPQEERQIEERMKKYIKALVKIELEKRAAEKKSSKTSCKVADLLKFMDKYERASKGKIFTKK